MCLVDSDDMFLPSSTKITSKGLSKRSRRYFAVCPLIDSFEA